MANATAARALEALAVGVLILPLFSLPVRGETLSGSATVPGGGVVTFEDASITNWVDGDLVLIYTNATETGSFTLPGITAARILAIGGGGGGGGAVRRATTDTSMYGGGGGGGGGGFVETNALFGAATYTVCVGAGGAGGVSHSTFANVTSGGSGGDTSILLDGGSWWLPVAKGGGGGGGGNNTPAGEGGSGGGGSQYSSNGTSYESKVGGAGTEGQGHSGGVGDAAFYGGGGGGAGAAGSPAAAGGEGGDGLQSDITGESLYYAGGGGGGYSRSGKTGAVISGGLGGGGGGGYSKGQPGDATFYGGGGGGGSYSNGVAGAGFCGVVVVRIAASVTGGLEKPKDVNFTFDEGVVHCAIETNAFYKITGDNEAEKVGVYKATAILSAGIKWADGTDDPVTVIMTISPKGSVSGTEYVTGAPISFAGATSVVRLGDDLLLKFEGAGSFTLPGSSSARILAIGGGGGGGGAVRRATTDTSMYGGGGGGGGGGFVETNALFGAATYTVCVGAGGEGGVSHSTFANVTSGGSGGDTSILLDGGSWWLPVAKGGGGGGGGNNTPAGEGGSGGGGSQYSSNGTSYESKVGGAGTEGQGHSGGVGDAAFYGGGGGGAGAAGSPAAAGGEGGDGLQSDITGESLYYAGGGGGGYSRSGKTGAVISGGLGGGGGGGYSKGQPGDATFYGGGGGGGSYSNGVAGAGFCGVVYLRISTAMVGEFTKPKDSFVEYDGNAHTSYVSNVFYDVAGEREGTTAGVYRVRVDLKSGVKWPDGTEDTPINVAMTIKKCPVNFTGLSISSWEFHSTPKTPSCTVVHSDTGRPMEWVAPIFEYADSKTAAEDEWSVEPPSSVGAHWVRVRAPDSLNYEYEPQYASFIITKAHVEFSALKQRDWMNGTPDEDTPKPTCTVVPSWVVPKYEYKDDDGNWVEAKPTSVGDHEIRVGAPDTDSYEFEYVYGTFKIVKGLGSLFTDYVEITISYTAGEGDPATLIDYPFAVTLAEDLPPGFTYSRADAKGNDLAFTSDDGETMYPYSVGNWATNSVSTLYVKIPSIDSGTTQTIRLYWHLRPDAVPPSHNPGKEWIAGIGEERAKVSTQPTQTIDTAVSRDGRLVNYWKKLPQMSKTVWESGDPPGEITQDAELAFGGVTRTITNIVAGVGYDAIPTDIGGSYRVIYEPANPDGYEPISCYIDFAILGHNPHDDLGIEGDELTKSGRVLLVNDDIAEGHVVSGQAYWREREVDCGDGTILTNDLFWAHTGDDVASTDMPYLLNGSSHRLFSIENDGSTNVIWRLEDVVIGNQFENEKDFAYYLCALPWSPTALSGTNYAARSTPMSKTSSACMVMRNIDGPCIYSPCYTNGIGTIYFDVVNGFNVPENDSAESYRIVVEVATETSSNKPPTDENARQSGKTGIEGELGGIGADKWVPYDMLPLKRDGGSSYFTALAATNNLALGIGTARSINNFYRVCVRVNCKDPVRFRIRRVSHNASRKKDSGSLILIDNIIVSPALNTVELKPYGTYDNSRRGNLVLGQAGAMSVPFPSVSDTEICPRAKAEAFSNGASGFDPAQFASLARIHYQWHYLDQAASEWKEADLSPNDGFSSPYPLFDGSKLESGDVRWWYETFVQTPYYVYYDYSGQNFNLADSSGKSLYSEEITSITNNNNGANWFFRLRAGKSYWEAFKVLVKREGSEDIESVDMEVIGDHLWRGLVRTPTNDVPSLQVRIEGWNLQTPGDLEFAENKTRFALADTVTKLPHASVLSALGEERWISVTNDAATGYLLFQVDDSTLGLSIVHADYQNFNGWNDANKDVNVGHFVGTSWYTNDLASGVSAEAREYSDDFSSWHASVEVNTDYWVEQFNDNIGNWVKYEPFTDTVSPNGFRVGPGQWIYGCARDANSGMALQMEGKGRGYIQFVNAAQTPRGLESIKFNARLGQEVEFDDFSYYDGTTKTSMTNYTFITKGAYDINKRKDFSGNGSLSIVAFYQPGEGCYELRIEQLNATLVSGQWTGPGDKHRLSLHRWRYDDASGEVIDTELGYRTLTGGTKDDSMMTTSGKNGKYGMLFISVKNEPGNPGRTLVAGGVSTGLYASSSPAQGSGTQDIAARSLAYIDTSSDRLAWGTYGVLTANCPGRFVYLQHSTPAATQPMPAANATVNKATAPDSAFKFPGTSSSTTTKCYYDILDNLWVVRKRRTAPFTSSVNDYGFEVAMPSNTVSVYTAPLGTTDWSLLTTTNIASFKYFDKPIDLKLWWLNDCAVKIASGGNAKTVRNDIVIDDIELRQWRGESYNGIEGSKYFRNVSSGSPTNFVFTQAWILTNDYNEIACRLSARRSRASEPTSIRTPLMDGEDGRGVGLGMIRFTYENAQTNVNLIVQIATNRDDATTARLADITGRTADFSAWTNVAEISFCDVSPMDRLSGTRSVYLGYHGVKGVARIILDPKCVNSVANETDTESFGEIDITSIAFKDEPDIDETSWWGWNLRTTGEDDKAYIGDRSGTDLYNGLSFALNNSTTEDIVPEDVALYPEHLPFLQTPTFSGASVGEVRFMARKYSATDATTRVVLFGASSGSVNDDTKWNLVWSWDIDSDRYKTYSYKVPPGQGYNAFRFAVTGVSGVDEKHAMPDPNRPLEPLRVLLDEVSVLEAVRSRVAFRNVAAFRNHLDTNRAISDIMSSAEQPLCREQFGVQGEIYASQLANEIDMSSVEVYLSWYESDEPWGYENWKKITSGTTRAKRAKLSPCEGTNFVFRSSHPDAPNAVIDPQDRPVTVQYMLEAVYDIDGGTATNVLEASDWVNPAWYHPLDLNAERKDMGFSAYTILDTIAPGYAWINEVNVNDELDDIYKTGNFTNQYVEIAIPAESDIYGWSLRFITGGLGDNARCFTNTVAVFGETMGVPSSKSVWGYANYVFPTVGNPKTATKATKAAGTIDGAWQVTDYSSDQSQLTSSGLIDPGYPIGVQLVRPSGIIEHSVVVAATNVYAGIPYYGEIFSATNFTAGLRKIDPRWFLAGEDDGGDAQRSLSATNQFAQEGSWLHLQKTPGKRNIGQYIDPDHPTPNGSSIILFANLEGGHINQSTGTYEEETRNLVLYVQKDSDTGTNIIYRTDHWYELDSITVNGVEVPGYAGLGGDGSPVVFTVAKNATASVTVTAKARIEKSLREKYDLGPGNAYTEAIMQWLAGGTTLRGPFANPLGDIELAKLARQHKLLEDKTLSLTEMYWLDIDPTIGNLVFDVGFASLPAPYAINTSDYHTFTNTRMSVYMMVSNLVDAAFEPYAPYTLRGLEPDSSSAGNAEAWTSATFKVTGYLANGMDSTKPEGTVFLPLKYYVFDANSFMPRGHVSATTGLCDEFQSYIEIEDPFSTSSPGFQAGWWKYPGTPVYYSFMIDSRLKPVGPQVLKAQDYEE